MPQKTVAVFSCFLCATFVAFLLNICKSSGIGLIVVTHDGELAKKFFTRELGVL